MNLVGCYFREDIQHANAKVVTDFLFLFEPLVTKVTDQCLIFCSQIQKLYVDFHNLIKEFRSISGV